VGDVWPGALLAAVAFESLKFGYTIYIAHFSNYDVAYGAFGGVFMLLFFTYLAFYLFYLGAEVAFVFPSVRDGTYVEEPAPGAALQLPRRKGFIGMVGGLLAVVGGLIASLFVSRTDE
jgi:uncharacterized BrkB/YihY/UPF0761 family membrane protein